MRMSKTKKVLFIDNNMDDIIRIKEIADNYSQRISIIYKHFSMRGITDEQQFNKIVCFLNEKWNEFDYYIIDMVLGSKSNADMCIGILEELNKTHSSDINNKHIAIITGFSARTEKLFKSKVWKSGNFYYISKPDFEDKTAKFEKSLCDNKKCKVFKENNNIAVCDNKRCFTAYLEAINE